MANMQSEICDNNYTLKNVRIFDGNQICEPSTVYICDGYISAEEKDAGKIEVIDCKNDVLLPGFIDAHVHLRSPDGLETLKQLCSYGITTALDMGCWPPELIDSLRSQPGLTDIRSAGLTALGTGSAHIHIPDMPTKAQVETEQQANEFLSERIKEKSDYIKIIADIPGLSQEVLDALVDAAKVHGKLVVAHAAKNPAFAMAQKAGVDVITHTPLEAVLSDTIIEDMRAAGTIAVPTLTMMEGIAKKSTAEDIKYANAKDSVTAMHKAGIKILAGSDANAATGVPFSPKFGDSLHRELELLVEAGMTNLEVLRAATSETATVFGLGDKGFVGMGRRADLVLLGGDPLTDIRETRSIRRVWCMGVEVEL